MNQQTSQSRGNTRHGVIRELWLFVNRMWTSGEKHDLILWPTTSSRKSSASTCKLATSLTIFRYGTFLNNFPQMLYVNLILSFKISTLSDRRHKISRNISLRNVPINNLQNYLNIYVSRLSFSELHMRDSVVDNFKAN